MAVENKKMKIRFTNLITTIVVAAFAMPAAYTQADELPLDKHDEVRSIGSGRVTLSMTPTGQWVAF